MATVEIAPLSFPQNHVIPANGATKVPLDRGEIANRIIAIWKIGTAVKGASLGISLHHQSAGFAARAMKHILLGSFPAIVHDIAFRNDLFDEKGWMLTVGDDVNVFPRSC